MPGPSSSTSDTPVSKSISDVSAAQPNAPGAGTKPRTIRRLLQIAATFAWWIAALFVSVGNLHWVRGWISVVFWVVGLTAVGLVVRHYNASIFEARARWRHKDTKRFDKIFLAIYLPLVVFQPVMAGLDAVRFHWSSMPFAFVFIGSLFFVVAMVLIAWVLSVNPFAETTVRIQADRGQTVITPGLYRLVRHPMYVGGSLMYLATPLIWGSVWALALGGLIAVLFIWRTAREDLALRQELFGYEEYATRTRYRLLPGVW
jgi:protein-S-isoprenylcysteine O-methyltransferase Ste14